MTVWPNGGTIMPAVSSSFGPRDASIPGASTMHRGVDFIGFPIVGAVDAGTVVAAGTPVGWSGGGRQVWVLHDGYFTRSLHLSGINVEYGDHVEAGQPIGTMGRTGTATGVHLHLELTPGGLTFWNSGQIDPVPFLAQRIGAAAGNGGEPFPPATPELPKEVIDMAGIPTLAIQDNGTWWRILNAAELTALGLLDDLLGKKVAKVHVDTLEASVYRSLAEKVYPAEKEKAIDRFLATGIALSQIPTIKL